MSAEKWAVRRNHLEQWEVLAPDDEAAGAFPWAGSPKPWSNGRWAFPFGSYEFATKALRGHFDGRFP